MKTPSELRIKKGTVIPPKGGWVKSTYYIVWASFSEGNPIHKYIFYSGFLNNGEPAGYNGFLSTNISDKLDYSSAYHLEVIGEISGIGGSDTTSDYYD